MMMMLMMLHRPVICLDNFDGAAICVTVGPFNFAVHATERPALCVETAYARYRLHSCGHAHQCCQHDAFLGLGNQVECLHSTCWGVWGPQSFLCWGAEGGLTGLTLVPGPHQCPNQNSVQLDSPCPLGCLASPHMQSPDSAKPLQTCCDVIITCF